MTSLAFLGIISDNTLRIVLPQYLVKPCAVAVNDLWKKVYTHFVG